MASLIVVSGPNEGDYYPLGKRTMVIGRQEGCAVQVVDDRVSRRHMQVRYEEADRCHHLLDMKSANGTLINGRQVDGEVVLRENDEIMVGNTKLVFSVRDFPDRESALSHYKQRGERMRPTIEA